jgi:tight adherence protein B
MLSAAAFLLVAGSIFFLTLVVAGVLGRALARYKERYVAQSMSDLSDMFLFVDPAQLLVLNLSLMAVLASMGLWLGGPLLFVLAGLAGFFTPMLVIRAWKRRRVRTFNAQLVEALQQISNALKAGLTFQQAVEAIARESKAPLQQEFGLFVKEVKLGVSIDDAMLSMARRVGSDDLELVATSSAIARSLGGNMADMFETIGGTIRERFRLEGRIDALTSQGRLQGWIVAAMPLALGMVLNYLRPDLIQPMFEGPNAWFGWGLVVGILLLESIGILLIRRIVDIDV